MVLALSRGIHSPKDHQQQLELAAFQSKVVVGYAQLVTVTTDEHDAAGRLHPDVR